MRCGAATLSLIIWTVQTAAQGADGLWSDTQRSSIDAVTDALVLLIEQAFPRSIPTDVNLQTVQWTSSFDIGGTTYTGVPSAPTTFATSVVSEGIPSNTAVQTFLTSGQASSTSTASSSTPTAASRIASPEPPQPTSMQEEGSEESNGGDRKVAIALGTILIVAAITLAGAIFFALWRRKRRSGSYFKAARCSECATTPTASILFRAGSVSTSRNDQTGTARSWFSGPRSAFTGSGRSARTNSVRANFPEMTESAERLPIPVDQIKGHQDTTDVCITQPRGHTRLRKSYSSTLANASVLSNESASFQPSTQPLELAGDGLEVINEMDAESSARTASDLRRLSSFPFVLPIGERASDAANTELGVMVSRSSSGNTNISELDAESPRIRRRHTSLTRLSINPMIMAQLAEAESEYYNSIENAEISRSNSDHSRPSEMDGESPTRRASTWRELQRSTFTVEDLTAEIEGFNALCEILESSGSETSSLDENRKELAGSFFDPKSATAWSELPGSSVYHATTEPIASDPSSSGSSTDGDASEEEEEEEEEEGPMGYVFTARDALPNSKIRTTELILPPRPPQPTYSREASSSISPLSSPPTANYPSPLPVANRDLILSRARFRSPNIMQPEVSPLPSATTSNKPAWAPAGAYATAPIWRKKRPAPLSPDFLDSCSAPTGGVNFGNVFFDSPTLPARFGAAGGGVEAYSNTPWRTKPRPQPLTPDWLPESLRAGRSAVKIAEDDEYMDLELGEQGGFSGKGDRYLAHEPNHGVGNLPSAIGFEMF